MNTLAMASGDLFPQVFIHAGYSLTACAFLVRDILWLRILAIFANLSLCTAATFAVSGPHWNVAAWTALFAAINLGHSAWLMYERHLARFTEEEARLHATAFGALDPVAVRKLLRRGRWLTFARDETIVRQGAPLDRLVLIAEGEAAVSLGGRVVARLGRGGFVGEIAFLTGKEATASVVAASELRCIVWPAADLTKALNRQPNLRTIVHAAIGRDMADKIAAHNLKPSQT